MSTILFRHQTSHMGAEQIGDALVGKVVSCIVLICDSVFNPYHVQVWKSRDVRRMR